MRRRISKRAAAAATFVCWLPFVQAQSAAGNAELLIVEGERRDSFGLDDASSTGSRIGLSQRDLPATVAVVTQEHIQAHGARTALEAIEGAVGMTGRTGVGSIPSYSTRGFSGSDITIMRDGIRQNTSAQSSRPLDSFLFERIEVLKGPASLLYGEGAIGGAVNYVSKKATGVASRELLLSAASWGEYRAGVGLGGPLASNELAYRLDLSFNQTGGYVDRHDEEYKAVGGEIRWTATDRTTVRFAFTALQDHIQSYYGTPVVYDAVTDWNGMEVVRPADTTTDGLVNPRIEPISRKENYNVSDNAVDATNTFTRAIVDSEIGDDWTLHNETYVATQRFDWRNAESYVWNPATERVDRGSFFLIWRRDMQIGNRLDLTHESSLGSRPNRFLVGVLYDHNDQDRNSGQDYSRDVVPASVPLAGFKPGVGHDTRPRKTADILTTTAAVYIEDVLDLTDKLKLVTGLRYDMIDVERISHIGAAPFTKSYSPLTGRVGFVYSLNPLFNFYWSYSTAAQPVTQLVSLDASEDQFSLQTGRQLEAGFKATVFDRRADMTLAIYDIEKNDLLTTTLVDGEKIPSQIGAQVSQGAEWTLGFTLPRGWRVNTNLAWNWKAEYEEYNQNLGTSVISRAGYTPSRVPKIVASLSTSRDFGNWSLAGSIYHVGEREANTNNGIQLPAYTKLDASATRRWETFSLTLRGRNLTDELYARGSGSGGLMWRLADPRSFELSMHYDF